MKCPHCLQGINSNPNYVFLCIENDEIPFTSPCGGWAATWEHCPLCHRPIIMVHYGWTVRSGKGRRSQTKPSEKTMLVVPKGINRGPIPADVPDHIKEDYQEACLVLQDSPKASAALGRRCLQAVIRKEANVEPKRDDLYHEIEALLDSKQLPSYLARNVDLIRHVGNWAAHTTWSDSPGEIVDVKDDEADCVLLILEGLFDHYYAKEAEWAKKREAVKAKAGPGKELLQPPEEPEAE